MDDMEPNPYESPHESKGKKPASDRRLLFAWDAFNVLLWLIVLGAIAAMLLPAVQ